ncbi:type I phosphodiesterase/nucleotide pyrophosphatase precursor [Geranomyces variabilis]|nr:type I phosphodiesterase/nucleotide pyrophosphatase precursor [Geranomyces variabilis]
MHAKDLDWYVSQYKDSAFAKLAAQGTTYTNAYASSPSDSFPGLAAIMTGGTPKTHGLWYDNTYDRSLYPASSDCKGPSGTQVEYTEAMDIDATLLNGGGGLNAAALPMSLVGGVCKPLFPNQFIRSNTIMEVAVEAGFTTAWADKHLVYQWVSGPSGKGLTDFPPTEINPVPGNKTADFDSIHINAAVNWMNGKATNGSVLSAVPAIFGFNMQAVSVAQKSLQGGYTADLTPSALLLDALKSVDAALTKLFAALDAAHLSDSTFIVLTAKHGQSPIDRTKLQRIQPAALANATGYPNAVLFQGGDDVGLLWFNRTANVDLAKVKANILKNANIDGAMSVLAGKDELLAAGFGDPNTDPRVPDVIVFSAAGVLYTDKAKSIADHGGNSDDDRHVMLLVKDGVNAAAAGKQVTDRVNTAQIAPTILEALGLGADKLQAVRAEGTKVLSAITFNSTAPMTPTSGAVIMGTGNLAVATAVAAALTALC